MPAPRSYDQLRAKLVIDPPNELCFYGPFNRTNITSLILRNPTDDYILYKIKTTAPKRYCVRPNFGTIDPRATIVVEICLQPFVYDEFETLKHKFMVQSVYFPVDGDAEERESYFQRWKDLPPGNFMDAKLKCVFIPEKSKEGEEQPNKSKNVTNEGSSPPKASAEEKFDVPDKTEMLQEELGQLRDTCVKLKQQTVNLVNENIRLKAAQSKPSAGEPYIPLMAEKQNPVYIISIIIAAVIFGVLLGRYL